MAFKQYLLIPGPTPIPERVIQAMARGMINHRGSEFREMLAEIAAGLKWAYQTENEVLIFSASGTGGMEAAVSNVLSAGDKVIVINIGAFGSRFVKIAEAFGAEVDEIRVERGEAADPKILEEKLETDKDRKIKAVLFQQNETSTGVLNDVETIARVVQKHGALTIVDAVSGLLTAPLKTDEWGLDVVVSGSQKAFMVPPGLSFVAVSKRAWKASEKAKMPRFYFDFTKAKSFAEKGETPWTPTLSVLYGIRESLKMLKEEGLEAIFARHEKMAQTARAGIKALGCRPLAEDRVASKAVTAVVPPEGTDPENLRKIMREKYGFVLAGGQEELKGKIFRIGHLGYVDHSEVVACLKALEEVLKA